MFGIIISKNGGTKHHFHLRLGVFHRCYPNFNHNVLTFLR